jgi:hypothetical protein
MSAKQYHKEKMLQTTRELISRNNVRFKAFMMMRIHNAVFCHDTARSAVGTNSSQEHTYRAFILNVGSICSNAVSTHHVTIPRSLFHLTPHPHPPKLSWPCQCICYATYPPSFYLSFRHYFNITV